MTLVRNELGQTIGFEIENWQGAQLPSKEKSLIGRYCNLQPIDPQKYGLDLFKAYQKSADNRIWTYLAYGPFADEADFQAWMEETCLGSDPFFYAVIDSESGNAAGVASYLRIDHRQGVIETGHINFSPALQRTRAATEALYLMLKHSFDDLGFRRHEWKCDAMNGPSIRAAQRFGFQFEGIFRQAAVYKNRNRDTAWFAIIDKDWPTIRIAFETWLNGSNFEASGQQKQSLSNLMAKALPDRTTSVVVPGTTS